MENLIGKKLVGSRTGRIIQAKTVGEDVALTIQRDGNPGTLSIQFSKEEFEALQRDGEVSGFRIVAEEQTESIKTSGYEKSDKKAATKKHLYVNKQIREALEKENTAMAKKVLDYLDKDLLRIVLEDEDAFYFETPSHASIPNYVHDYLVKECEKILGVPYYLKRDKRTSGYEERGKRDGTGSYKDSYQRRHFDIGKRRQRGEPCPFETKDSKIASLIRKRIASRSRTITGQDNPADRPEGLFTRKEIEDLLREMKTYYTDGEIESGKYLLSIEITKDSAGDEGWVYSWDLGALTESGASVDYWIDGDGYFYSDEELIDSLVKAGIVV